jgi:cell division protein FtsN
MILPIALAALSLGPDSLVTPLPTGGLTYEHVFTSWTEVVGYRQKANLAGFGSVANELETGTYIVEFRIYGDSSAQTSQANRLEKLLNEPLVYVDRTTVYILPSVDTGEELAEVDEVPMDMEAIARKDSLHAVRHIAISDEHRRVAVDPAGDVQQDSNALDLESMDARVEIQSMEPLEGETNLEVSSPMQKTSVPEAEPEQPSPPVQKEKPALAPEKPAERPASQANGANEPVVPVKKNTTAPSIPVEKAVNMPEKANKPSKVASQPTQTDLTHPFQDGVTHVIVLGSFGNRDYAENYQLKALVDHPSAKIWLVKGMYRVGIGYPYYPGNALKELKVDWPKAWVCPLP